MTCWVCGSLQVVTLGLSERDVVCLSLTGTIIDRTVWCGTCRKATDHGMIEPPELVEVQHD